MALELIIGAKGFLGQFLAQAMQGRDCVLHSRTPASAICRATGLRFVQEDLVESRTALAALEPETVYLLARPVTQEAGVLLDFAQNVQWLLQEWADRRCLKRVVFASTQLVYATPGDEKPIPVTSPLGPETAYDCHKAAMEFYLSLLAHHPCGVCAEVYRLPLLAGRMQEGAEGRAQALQQFVFQWRAEYLAGACWKFPREDPRHALWGNSWVHVDDLVKLMIEPRPGEVRFKLVQPVSGHASYLALDGFFRERYKIAPQNGTMHLGRTMFYLQDNAGCRQRGLDEAFPEEGGR
jgi:nucleoside-diphosphate-sugar epimerase